MNIDNLQPGVELDRLVAEALGMEYMGFCRRGPVYQWPEKMHSTFAEDYECGVSFRPSIDWNDAMWAAEKAELFATGPNEEDSFGFIDLVTDGGPNKWRVCRHRFNEYESLCIAVIATADTGPLAICIAILKAKEVKPDHSSHTSPPPA